MTDEDPFAGLPGAVGDNREKFVRVTLGSGEREEHGDVYFRYSAGEFFVSPDPGFPDDETTRYDVADTARLEVLQHHSKCFITTAVDGEGRALDDLRGFRDDVLATRRVGRGLVALYDAVSPPVAATLSRHPDARTTRAVRWLVERCAGLVRYRDRSPSGVQRALVSVAVGLLYVVGLLLAVAGHARLRIGEHRSQVPTIDGKSGRGSRGD